MRIIMWIIFCWKQLVQTSYTSWWKLVVVQIALSVTKIHHDIVAIRIIYEISKQICLDKAARNDIIHNFY